MVSSRPFSREEETGVTTTFPTSAESTSRMLQNRYTPPDLVTSSTIDLPQTSNMSEGKRRREEAKLKEEIEKTMAAHTGKRVNPLSYVHKITCDFLFQYSKVDRISMQRWVLSLSSKERFFSLHPPYLFTHFYLSQI